MLGKRKVKIVKSYDLDNTIVCLIKYLDTGESGLTNFYNLKPINRWR